MSSEEGGASFSFGGSDRASIRTLEGVSLATRCSMKFDLERRCFLRRGLAGRARVRSRRERGLSRELELFPSSSLDYDSSFAIYFCSYS